MGEVWRAIDTALNRVVALKQIQLDGLDEHTVGVLTQRTLHEGQTIARLPHPNIVAVHDVVADGERLVLVLEYVESRGAAALLDSQGPFPLHLAAQVGAQMAEALATVHAQGVLHRDVTPGNVLIDTGWNAKLTDFGISHAAIDLQRTATAESIGTPAYMAPETARGETATPATDIYGLGATIWALVEGTAPYHESGSENPMRLMHRIATGHLDPPTDAGQLTEVLTKMTGGDPARRPDAARARDMFVSAARVIAAQNPAPPAEEAVAPPAPEEPDSAWPSPAPVYPTLPSPTSSSPSQSSPTSFDPAQSSPAFPTPTSSTPTNPAQPSPTSSGPAQPNPARSSQASPTPAQPNPAEPTPTSPAQAQRNPASFAPAQPNPAQPSPTSPPQAPANPSQPSSTSPAPARPNPAQSSPTSPTPAQPNPAQSKPAQPSLTPPAQASPTQQSPASPAPAEPNPAQSSPASPTPAQPNPAWSSYPAPPSPTRANPGQAYPPSPRPGQPQPPRSQPSQSRPAQSRPSSGYPSAPQFGGQAFGAPPLGNQRSVQSPPSAAPSAPMAWQVPMAAKPAKSGQRSSWMLPVTIIAGLLLLIAIIVAIFLF